MVASRYILLPIWAKLGAQCSSHEDGRSRQHDRASRDVTSGWLMAWQCGRKTADAAVREDGLADDVAARDEEGLMERHHGLPDGRGYGSWAEDDLAVGVVDGRRHV